MFYQNNLIAHKFYFRCLVNKKHANRISKNSSNTADEIDLGRLFNILLEAKWLIITITFLFAVIGVMYALLATPIYKADA
ncbi:tyrosine-protein kinase Wzc [Vibrio maritimus]|uniref:Tyrosine-protein kinase Wzc n=1 Tax=Vibrio maritimus TaxID=990268 RepID=A0A090S6E2_9VIBR|nr:tyrosine-protein kinase Wzc [Vibrio maritimus]